MKLKFFISIGLFQVFSLFSGPIYSNIFNPKKEQSTLNEQVGLKKSENAFHKGPFLIDFCPTDDHSCQEQSTLQKTYLSVVLVSILTTKYGMSQLGAEEFISRLKESTATSELLYTISGVNFKEIAVEPLVCLEQNKDAKLLNNVINKRCDLLVKNNNSLPKKLSNKKNQHIGLMYLSHAQALNHKPWKKNNYRRLNQPGRRSLK